MGIIERIEYIRVLFISQYLKCYSIMSTRRHSSLFSYQLVTLLLATKGFCSVDHQCDHVFSFILMVHSGVQYIELTAQPIPFHPSAACVWMHHKNVQSNRTVMALWMRDVTWILTLIAPNRPTSCVHTGSVGTWHRAAPCGTLRRFHRTQFAARPKSQWNIAYRSRGQVCILYVWNG